MHIFSCMMLQTALVSYKTYWPRLFRQFKRVNLILEKRQTDSGQTTRSEVKVSFIRSFVASYPPCPSADQLTKLKDPTDP